MTLQMAHCIGRPGGCDATPGARGLCKACYARHASWGTLDNYPTMRERTRELRAQSQILQRNVVSARQQAQTARRHRLRAERTLVNGFMVHPTTDGHGSLYIYTTYSCRGPMCRASQAWYINTGETKLPDVHRRGQTPNECATYEEWGTYR